MRHVRLAALVTVGIIVGACRGGTDRAPAPSPTPVASPELTIPPPTSAPTAPPTPTPATTPKAGQGALLDPSKAKDRAPEKYRVRFETTKGAFVVEVNRTWAPRGADRFYNLVRAGFFDDVTFFRVISGFMVQFGIHGKPDVAAAWRDAQIEDDPVKESNRRGTLTFATAGPNTRTTQVFVNFKDNTFLDGQGFAPFGQVVEGMSVVDSLYAGYGEGAPQGAGPNQMRAQSQGNAYFRRDFPKLDHIQKARLEKAPAAAAN